MPVITPQARASVSAQTEDSWRAPTKSIVANTKAQTVFNPFTAPDAPEKAAEPAESAQESGQPNTSVEEVKSEQTVTLSSQATAIARMEQKLRKQEQSLKAQKADLEAKQAEVANLGNLKQKLAAKDYSALEELGVTYEEYVNYKLNQGEEATPENKAISEMREELNRLKASQEENTTKQYEATVNQYRSDIKALIAKDPTYSSVKELKAEDHVLQHILDTFEQDGEALSIEQAAQEVEDALIEEAERMAKLTKVQAKLAPPKTEQKRELPPPKSQGLRTITQTLPTATPKTFGQFQHLSPKERLAQALAKAQKPPQ